jgi:hypothetical protein
VTQLLLEGKTTGHTQSAYLLDYAKLNEQRMNRIEKTFRLAPEAAELLEAVDRPVTWLILTEGWCGDASQIIPVLHGLALQNPNITLKFLLRDEHPELMDAFLTDGARSIPIVIFVNPDSNRVIGFWGPRPEAAQSMVLAFKKRMVESGSQEEKDALYEEVKTAVHTWYAHDKGASTQREILQHFKAVAAITTPVQAVIDTN